ncbi:sigma-70 family RNA polymerase sigma factor [Iningainema tapete]|uniref:Sigma-70 family RNA polymerase sigma factor n=1 Tax=Iningainema tapete BLCC-T55 TaxID=2748662 RepID=A0A8J6XK45_9CYAN|nr:sigma-70 family RNA polymerase sigma factor [Iningainema tapete]MBD2776078.1 sigma-70 family RNA polymerase sigma factor [Iningainema tapete BLCC-T55]
MHAEDTCQLDKQLKELATAAQQQPQPTKSRRVALSKLVDAIWKSPKLYRPYSGQSKSLDEDVYDEAVQNLFLYICNNINKYNPERGTVMTWVNMLLTQRFFPEAVRKIIGRGNEIKLEDSHLENLPSSEDISLFKEVLKFIEDDPEGIFALKHIKGYPEANFQAIAIKRILGITWKDISAEWGISIPSLSTFYQRCLQNFAPIFREYL